MRSRPSNNAEPTRTIVAPSSIAISKSPLMPIDSSSSGHAGRQFGGQAVAEFAQCGEVARAASAAAFEARHRHQPANDTPAISAALATAARRQPAQGPFFAASRKYSLPTARRRCGDEPGFRVDRGEQASAVDRLTMPPAAACAALCCAASGRPGASGRRARQALRPLPQSCGRLSPKSRQPAATNARAAVIVGEILGHRDERHRFAGRPLRRLRRRFVRERGPGSRAPVRSTSRMASTAALPAMAGSHAARRSSRFPASVLIWPLGANWPIRNSCFRFSCKHGADIGLGQRTIDEPLPRPTGRDSRRPCRTPRSGALDRRSIAARSFPGAAANPQNRRTRERTVTGPARLRQFEPVARCFEHAARWPGVATRRVPAATPAPGPAVATIMPSRVSWAGSKVARRPAAAGRDTRFPLRRCPAARSAISNTLPLRANTRCRSTYFIRQLQLQFQVVDVAVRLPADRLPTAERRQLEAIDARLRPPNWPDQRQSCEAQLGASLCRRS